MRRGKCCEEESVARRGERGKEGRALEREESAGRRGPRGQRREEGTARGGGESAKGGESKARMDQLGAEGTVRTVR